VTEAEWLACADPVPMLAFLRRKASPRKLRLFAVACARRLGEHNHPLARHAVDVAERFADGEASAEELRAARLACKHADESAAWYAAISQPEIAARNAALSARGVSPHEPAAQAELLRDIIGNPFQDMLAVQVGDEIARLAREIYTTRAFERLATLANSPIAPDARLLAHFRNKGPHVRGCWALDVVLAQD
jgi:hypothetical protein